MAACVFCSIASGEIEADIVARGDGWVAFRDLHPQAPVHVLVVPTTHMENLDQVDDGSCILMGRLLLGCREVARVEGLDGGYRVVANVGSDGGQTVGHLHLHVLGGRRLGWPPG